MREWLWVLLLGATLITAGSCWHSIEDLRIQFAALMEVRSMDGVMTSTWTSNGVAQSYTTTQREGETEVQHATRHAAGLAAMLEQFPKDP